MYYLILRDLHVLQNFGVCLLLVNGHDVDGLDHPKLVVNQPRVHGQVIKVRVLVHLMCLRVQLHIRN